MTNSDLLKIAVEAKEKAYVPYSGFRVGAAVVTENEKVYEGQNIENASYGATNCAERTAIFKAVSSGERKIKAIAIASDSKDIIYPCGICRQVIAEFGDVNTIIICSSSSGEFREYKLDEIYPFAFNKEAIDNGGKV
jgi:cytidine deaminase